MTADTDERLKSYLDTNQLARERMCCALLAIHGRFSEIKPRQPRGGPDEGRDIEAIYQKEKRAFGAVGFKNQANDSSEHKQDIKRKFRDDAQRALSAGESPEVFVFMTNVNLTVTEKEELTQNSRDLGFTDCEILDRERLRILLDSPDGLAFRYQYLGLSLSESEQASFFSKWGDDIQSTIATGFHRIEQSLERLIFLQESRKVLVSLSVSLQLDRQYSADEIGHFRAYCYLFLKEPIHGILQMLFGVSDRPKRMWPKDDIQWEDFREQKAGIRYGISRGQWEVRIDEDEEDEYTETESEDEDIEYTYAGASSSIGADTVEFIPIVYSNESFIRLQPKPALEDLDESTFILLVNSALASKIQAIHVIANGYKLMELRSNDFEHETTDDPDFPVEFTEEELTDEWAILRPLNPPASVFLISFFNQTPKRLFESPLAPDSIGSRRNRRDDESDS